MAQIVSESRAIDPAYLHQFVRACFVQAGLPPPDADLVARSLVESNLRGIDSHGVARLPHYLNRIRHGSIQPQPKIETHRLAPALARVDGGHGMGQLAMHRATAEAITIAGETGAGWVAVENSTHCGALAFYGLQIAHANMIGLVFTHSDSMVVPHGARHAFCGTNPICLVAPGENGEDLCLDLATSIVPWNTISNAAIENVAIPDSWAVDAAGQTTTNPLDVRGVHPFGAHKGSGLGLMIDVLCSFLLGTPHGTHIAAMYGDPAKQRLLGGLVGAIDIAKFRPAGQFRAAVASLIREWTAQAPRTPGEPVLYPGQPELLTRKQRLTAGIPLGVHLLEIFGNLSRELGVPWKIEDAAARVPAP
jgi:ureidoglycolate dehydrogenase (NAD+)